MALTNCSRCGAEIGAIGGVCPNCAKPIRGNSEASRRRALFFACLWLTGVATVAFMAHNSPSARTEGRSATNAESAPTPGALPPSHIDEVAKPSSTSQQNDDGVKVYYLTMGFPCAVDEATLGVMAGAITSKDEEALQGLQDRGLTLWLTEGTKFQGLPFPHGVVLGYVRSGRNIGKECYLMNDVCLLYTSRCV